MQALSLQRFMFFVRVVGKRVDADASARHEIAGHLEVLGVHQLHQILHNDIHAILVKITMVAEREQVQLEALALDHTFARDITDVDMPEVRLSGFRTKSRELGTVEGHQVLVLGVFVLEGLEHFGVVLVRVCHMLVAKQGHALQFFFCSHIVSIKIPLDTQARVAHESAAGEVITELDFRAYMEVRALEPSTHIVP